MRGEQPLLFVTLDGLAVLLAPRADSGELAPISIWRWKYIMSYRPLVRIDGIYKSASEKPAAKAARPAKAPKAEAPAAEKKPAKKAAAKSKTKAAAPKTAAKRTTKKKAD